MKLIKGAIFLGTLVAIILGAVKLVNTSDENQLEKNSENMTLQTSDNKNIAYDYYSVESPHGWIVFTHMMPTTKESWKVIAETLQKDGYESIAIDLRGHGESDGGPDGYVDFSDSDHQKSIEDIAVAWKFLQSRGAMPEKTVLIGASIGANISLQFLTQHPEIRGGVFLSPGDYKGIDSGQLVSQLSPTHDILFVASKQDVRADGNNADNNQKYYNTASQVKNRHLIIFDSLGHGTDLFNNKEEYNLEATINKFLKSGEIL